MKVRPLLIRTLKPLVRPIGFVLIARRQFNLPRWTSRQVFVAQRAIVVAWLDSHFAALEHGAPWLHRVGSDVWDYCSGLVPSPFQGNLFEPRRFASLGCDRGVIAVYGFDGDLTERLNQLREALSAAGWERTVWRSRAWVPSDSGQAFSWRPTAALSYPPGPDGRLSSERLRRAPSLWVSWCSRGQATSLQQHAHRTRHSTRNRLVLESSATEPGELPDAALEKHDHALAVYLNFRYPDLDSPARRRREPRYLLPTRPVR
ncbi:hypothetical protein [Streptacidiphilus fuscans]|uniref:Uncharacterized protein n=1 Tax=Streptacidiphilus fuscans TaxID=2789292 RepID=A0A931B8W9_9ACTN|nr:hypothetical protein [Streptacidiphilus fuscans]MBF9069953.1 hypothetical protein [Streptacidiphilus fuscans]